MVFGIYSNTMNYAYAVSVNTITFPAGVTTTDVSYRTDTSDTDTTAYIIGQSGGQAYAWKKSGSTDTILFNVTLTGSVSARAIEYNEDIIAVYAVTNDKFYKLTTNLAIAGQLASGTANIVRDLVYDDTHNLLYFCTNDTYGTVNQVTLSITTLYNDPNLANVLGCSIDEANNFMYLVGDNIGTGAISEVIKINLNTHTQVDSFNDGTDLFFAVCFDPEDNKVWITKSATAQIKKFDSDLNLENTITVGTTPRYCSISTDQSARRLYVANEATDNVSIVDIEANVVLSTASVCNTVGTGIDTKRLFNTTNTYITCTSNTNSVVIDNTVSEVIPPNIINGVNCDLPENNGILTCDTSGTGLSGTSELVNQSATNIFCQVGFFSCTQDSDGNFIPDNPDVKTNGVGYILLVIALAIFVSLLWVASGGRITEIPTFVWFIGTIAMVGVFTAIDYIDPTFLIIAIIVVSAFATAKYKSVLGDNSLFKGE